MGIGVIALEIAALCWIIQRLMAGGNGISRFSDFIGSQLRSGLDIPSAPSGWPRLLVRCRWTFAIIILNVLAYIWSMGFHRSIPSQLLRKWGFSWPLFVAHPAQALVLSPFLHNNATHIMVNLASIFVFTGGLEYLGGSLIAGACYVLPMLIANPVTCALFVAGLRPFFPSLDGSVTDIGASLGAYGSLGGLYWFLRYGNYWLTAAIAIPLLGFVFGSWQSDWILLDHCTALLLGLAVAACLKPKG